MSDIIPFIEANRESPFVRSAWLDGNLFRVYLRVSARYFDVRDRSFKPAIAISHIIVDKKHQRKGVFKKFLAEMEAKAVEMKFDILTVEQVGNPHLRRYLLSHGFSFIDDRVEYLSDCVLVKDIVQK